MDVSVLTSNPTYQKMEPQKQKLLLDCVKQSEGESLQKALPILLSMNQRMKSLGIQFTTEEREVLVDALTSHLSPAERVKVDALKKMMR